MTPRPLVLLIFCCGFFIFIQSIVPKVLAMKKSNVDEYMLEDQRTRKRKNYVVRLARESEIFGDSGNIGPYYETDYFQPDTSDVEDLSALIVDYANMIRRNGVILLDNSIEIPTRKRANIKQALPDIPCSCESSLDTKDLGENTFPRIVEVRNCGKSKQQSCLPPYACREDLYNITIIRRREFSKQESLDLPNELKYKWVAEKRPISVGCVCTRDYYIQN